MKVILASNSKTRQNIFDMIGIKYEVITSKIEEKSNANDPIAYVEELSKNKAKSVANQINEKAIIISADTIIYMNGKIYEKPRTKEEAAENMREMSGKKTQAITGMTIKDLYQDKEIVFHDKAEVTLNKISEADISWYIENEENLLKSSGYVLLGKGAFFIDKVNGDYNTLFGISPSKVYDKIKELGYKLSDFEVK